MDVSHLEERTQVSFPRTFVGDPHGHSTAYGVQHESTSASCACNQSETAACSSVNSLRSIENLESALESKRAASEYDGGRRQAGTADCPDMTTL